MRKTRAQYPKSNPDQKILGRAIALVVFVSILWIMFAPNSGLLRYRQVHHQVESLTRENNALEAKNTELLKEINMLGHDKRFIEEIARKKYGFIKNNEMLFNFEGNRKK